LYFRFDIFLNPLKLPKSDVSYAYFAAPIAPVICGQGGTTIPFPRTVSRAATCPRLNAVAP